MYHHHIISRPNEELIKKVYQKQKQNSLKGDWYRTLEEDFKFIGETINDDHISLIPNYDYRKLVKQKVQKAAFLSYLELKEKSKKKMKHLEYKTFAIQPYITSEYFSLKQIKLLYSLRSHCYKVKMNSKKMHRGDLKCTFLCDQEETQIHVFEQCQPIKQQLGTNTSMQLKHIYGTLTEQLEAIIVFEKIDDMRKVMLRNILPGESSARTPALM